MVTFYISFFMGVSESYITKFLYILCTKCLDIESMGERGGGEGTGSKDNSPVVRTAG